MKIPSRVRITTRVTYEVVFIDAFENPDVLGECRYDSKQIVISRKQSDEEVFSTLVHEIFHAMSHHARGANLTETQVRALEKATVRVLKLNKWHGEK